MPEIEWINPESLNRPAPAMGCQVLVANLRASAMQGFLALEPSQEDLADERRPGASERSWFRPRRSALRHLVAMKLGCAPLDVIVAYDAPGAPRVRAPQRCEISVSSRGSLMALAVADRPVGVDIEVLDGMIDVVDDILHVNERAELSALRGDRLRERFLQIWTAKEAFLKALGSGLTIDPARVAVDIRRDDVHVRHGETEGRGVLRAFDLEDKRYQVACILL